MYFIHLTALCLFSGSLLRVLWVYCTYEGGKKIYFFFPQEQERLIVTLQKSSRAAPRQVRCLAYFFFNWSDFRVTAICWVVFWGWCLRSFKNKMIDSSCRGNISSRYTALQSSLSWHPWSNPTEDRRQDLISFTSVWIQWRSPALQGSKYNGFTCSRKASLEEVRVPGRAWKLPVWG